MAHSDEPLLALHAPKMAFNCILSDILHLART